MSEEIDIMVEFVNLIGGENEEISLQLTKDIEKYLINHFELNKIIELDYTEEEIEILMRKIIKQLPEETLIQENKDIEYLNERILKLIERICNRPAVKCIYESIFSEDIILSDEKIGTGLVNDNKTGLMYSIDPYPNSDKKGIVFCINIYTDKFIEEASNKIMKDINNR